MNQGLRRGVSALSWTRVFSPRTPQWQGIRRIQIRSAASEQPDSINGAHLPIANTPNAVQSSDARFEVIGTPYSLLSVSLSASQNLYTRRGTLVGLSGKADNVVSSLSILEPVRRAPVGIPFLYQKVSSASPVTALISVRNPTTSFGVVHLDGSVDWMVSQRRALLAWTGRSVSLRPVINKHMSLSHWGSSEVTGRGLLALVGNGQLYNIELKRGEQYIAHPSNVVAYTMTSNSPRPYRFKSTTLNFQVPGLKTLPSIIQNSNFVRNMSDTDTWKTAMKIFHKIRTWSRMTIWGDRLFLQFDGPTNILVQSRGARINDILSERQVNEIAGTPRGLILDPSTQSEQKSADGKSGEQKFREEADKAIHAAPVPARSVDDLVQEVKGHDQKIATLTQEGKILFEKPGQKK